METVENLKFDFVSEDFKILEKGNDNGKHWIRIGGTSLVEGVSRNKNKYSFKNLEENNGREFKYLVGHPDNAEEHVIGLGKNTLKEGKLVHEGRIRNTARYPDAVENVIDRFWGPSIHASAEKVTRNKEGLFEVEGLTIDGVGLVAFQGVEKASVDYAVAESFDKRILELNELKKSVVGEQLKEENGDTMGEEKTETTPPQPEVKQEQSTPAPAPEAPKEEEKKPEEKPEEKQETVSQDEFNKLKEELEAMKNTKQEEKASSKAIVEDNIVKKENGIVETNEGFTMSESDIKKQFNELKEKVI